MSSLKSIITAGGGTGASVGNASCGGVGSGSGVGSGVCGENVGGGGSSESDISGVPAGGVDCPFVLDEHAVNIIIAIDSIIINTIIFIFTFCCSFNCIGDRTEVLSPT